MLAELGPWGDVGALGLLLGAVWLVMTGRLVPARTVDQMRRSYEQQITDWRSTAQTAMKTTETLAAPLGEVVELARTTESVVRALAPPIRERAS